MRQLLWDHVAQALKCDVENAKCLVITSYGIGYFSCGCFSNILLIDFSDNDLQSLQSVFEAFPTVWWLNLSLNQVSKHFSHTLNEKFQLSQCHR